MKIQMEKIKLATLGGRDLFQFVAKFQSDDGKDYVGRGNSEAQCIRQLALAVSLNELRGK